MLANHLNCCGFDYISSQDVFNEVKQQYSLMQTLPTDSYYPDSLPEPFNDLIRVGEWPLYRSDMIVRHAEALQSCGAADLPAIRINSLTAKRLNLGDTATVSQGDIGVTLPLICDDRIVEDTVWVANAMLETSDLGPAYGAITII